MSKHHKNSVRAKKHLGQHFLTDETIAKRIADTLEGEGYKHVLEIGPGTGVMTKYLLEKDYKLSVIDLDEESIDFLKKHYNELEADIIYGDFLKFSLEELFDGKPFAIIGNFPYNISTQIVFKALENKHLVPEFSGMFQMEVAKRICSKEGSKVYGILSVLTQVFYEAEYLFTVPPTVFAPPPKVESGVLRLTRKENLELPCSEKMLYRVVKLAFQQRRKTLRNSLKQLQLSDELREDPIFSKRPEQLSPDTFVALTQRIEEDLKTD